VASEAGRSSSAGGDASCPSAIRLAEPRERMVENVAFYESLGYEETERRAERGFKRVFLRKRLTPSA